MLKQRVITGIVLALIVAAAIYFLPSPMFAQVALLVIVVLGGWEWTKLSGVPDGLRQAIAIVLMVVLAEFFWWTQWPIGPILLVSLVVWAYILKLLVSYQADTTFYQQHPLVIKIIAVLVLIPAWYALVELHQLNYWYVFYLISLTALADSSAYFIGKRFGKTKLAPALSPGKTREGAYGALIVTGLWALFWGWMQGFGVVQTVFWTLFSVAAVMLSIAGDLFESLLKRQAGAKDSGTLLPGHGGILDRIDSLLAAAPFFTLGVFIVVGRAGAGGV